MTEKLCLILCLFWEYDLDSYGLLQFLLSITHCHRPKYIAVTRQCSEALNYFMLYLHFICSCFICNMLLNLLLIQCIACQLLFRSRFAKGHILTEKPDRWLEAYWAELGQYNAKERMSTSIHCGFTIYQVGLCVLVPFLYYNALYTLTSIMNSGNGNSYALF